MELDAITGEVPAEPESAHARNPRLAPGVSPTEVARQYDISSGQLCTWRHALLAAQPEAVTHSAGRFARVLVNGCVRDRASRLVLAGHHGYDPCVVWGERDAVPGMQINSRQGTTGAHGTGLPPVSLPVWEAVQRAQHRLVEPDAISE
jgi:hypothetical protein